MLKVRFEKHDGSRSYEVEVIIRPKSVATYVTLHSVPRRLGAKTCICRGSVLIIVYIFSDINYCSMKMNYREWKDFVMVGCVM